MGRGILYHIRITGDSVTFSGRKPRVVYFVSSFAPFFEKYEAIPFLKCIRILHLAEDKPFPQFQGNESRAPE